MCIRDSNNTFSKTAYTYAGVLSASFFTTALLAMVLAKRVEISEQIARQQSRDINDLVQLNEYIIKHLQSGIIVVDHANVVRLANAAANTLLSRSVIIGDQLSDASVECWHLFKRWLREPSEHAAVLASTPNTPRLKLRFNRLDSMADNAYIIFLDDLSGVDQQIQQGKLASLGRLTASIAHEIRNPLGAISHAGELLSESSSIEKDDQRLLDIIHNHSGRVNSIVKSVLQLSRQEESHIEQIEFKSWLAEVDHDFKDQFGLVNSPLDITLPNSVKMISYDKNHLNQITDNLCNNALKYSQKTNTPHYISLSVSTQAATQRTQITISDNGSGMNEKTALQIFEPFFTTSPTGTGLGLYISSQLSELNHAKLSYNQHSTGGSSFTLTFANTTDHS